MRFFNFKFLLVCVLFHGILLGQEKEKRNLSIIPLPAEVELREGYFVLPERAVVCFGPGAKTSAEWLQQLLSNTYVESYAMPGSNCVGFSLELDSNLQERLGEEGYELEITRDVVYMKAATNAGLFYAIQTFRQILPAELENKRITGKLKLPQLKIVDSPAFTWRGSMLDLARSYFGVEYLKRHLDRMALYKLNRLHLHLSDDQGWRLELKNYPKLTEVGGKSAVINGRSGFLTSEEYMELQDYALARNIVIVPEIDMPGHIYSALTAYPELNCDDLSNLNPKLAVPPQQFQTYEVGWSKLCLEKPEVQVFVSEVIKEVSNKTLGKYLHIGGDEIEDENYEDFVMKVDSIVRANGKIPVGWEDVTKAPVSDEFISQRWNGKTRPISNVKIIESICSNFYFDHANEPGQPKTNNWCKEEGVSLEDAYSVNIQEANVIGVESALWTELVTTNEMADERFWPRSIATAEVGWTPGSKRKWEDFKKRLGKHGKRLDRLNVGFYRTPEIEWNVEYRDGIFSGFMPEDSK